MVNKASTVIISAILFQFNSTQQSNFLDWWLIEEERLSEFPSLSTNNLQFFFNSANQN